MFLFATFVKLLLNKQLYNFYKGPHTQTTWEFTVKMIDTTIAI